MATTSDNDSGETKTGSPRGRRPGTRAKNAASTAKRSASQRTSTAKRGSNGRGKSTGNGSATGQRRSSSNGGRRADAMRSISNRINDVPSWVATLASVVGVGVAVGAGLYATRNQWLPRGREWADDFNAAFADGEADPANFDQTRHAGRESMRDDPGEDWDDIDDLSDASFPASDPPSFSPGKA